MCLGCKIFKVSSLCWSYRIFAVQWLDGSMRNRHKDEKIETPFLLQQLTVPPEENFPSYGADSCYHNLAWNIELYIWI